MEMTKSFESFLEASEDATKRLLQTSFKHISDYEKSDKTPFAVEEIIILTKPRTLGTLKLLIATFKNYANYMEDANLAAMLEEIDVNSQFESILQTFDIGKFFTYGEYQEALRELSESQDEMTLYYKSLLMSLYEGIKPSDHFRRFIDLRAGDVGEGYIILRSPEPSFVLAVSCELCENLRELSSRSTYHRNGKTSPIEIDIVGKHVDSCFKVEKRQSSGRVSPEDSSYENVFRRHIREKIAPLFGYPVKAMDIYMSGLLHRIADRLYEEGYSLYDGFAKHLPDQRPREILKEELRRCHYDVTIDNLRKSITGHIHGIAAETMTRGLLPRIASTSPERILAEEEADDDLIRSISLAGNMSFCDSVSEPKPKKELRPRKGRMAYPRSMTVALGALDRADYRCEIDSAHATFISNQTGKPYMEIHHLVPIAYSDCFACDLDVPSNAVVLCCNCHRMIHYGREKIQLIRKLYLARRDSLAQSGISIDFESLLRMYGINQQR